MPSTWGSHPGAYADLGGELSARPRIWSAARASVLSEGESLLGLILFLTLSRLHDSLMYSAFSRAEMRSLRGVTSRFEPVLGSSDASLSAKLLWLSIVESWWLMAGSGWAKSECSGLGFVSLGTGDGGSGCLATCRGRAG